MPLPKVMSPGSSPRQYTPAEKAKYAAQVRIRAKTQAAQKNVADAQVQQIKDYYAKNGHIPTILANESRNRFADANATDLAELGKQVALGKMTREQALALVDKGTAGINDLNRRAGLAASAEIDPGEIAARNNIAALNTAFAQQQAYSKNLGESTVARQKALYDALQRSIAAEPAAIEQNYGQTSQQVGQNFDAALAATKGNFDAASTASNAEAARLGLQDATPVANAQGQNNAAFIQGLLQSQKLGAQGTLANLQQTDINNSNSFNRSVGAEGVAAQSGTLGNLAMQQQQALMDKQAQEAQYNSSIQQLESTRAPKLQENLDALLQARQQAIQDEQDRQFQQSMAQQTLGVKQYEAQTNRQQVENAAKKTNAELQKIANESIPGTLEYETAVAAIELKKSQAAAALSNAKTNQQNANTHATEVTAKLAAANTKAATQQYGKGMLGVQQYLKDAGVDDKTFALIMKHVNNTIITHDNGDYKNGLRGVEGYITAHKLPADIANVFRIATAIAYGKSGK